MAMAGLVREVLMIPEAIVLRIIQKTGPEIAGFRFMGQQVAGIHWGV
jgi:hypothetical protein